MCRNVLREPRRRNICEASYRPKFADFGDLFEEIYRLGARMTIESLGSRALFSLAPVPGGLSHLSVPEAHGLKPGIPSSDDRNRDGKSTAAAASGAATGKCGEARAILQPARARPPPLAQ